jgi:3-phosphoshikimate 1-carboxyvinyltransferase
MRRLGADVVRVGEGEWRVHGVGVGGFREPADVLDFGNSGTGVRLTMGAVATTPITTIFTGDASLKRRPMRRVLDPLGLFGAVADAREGGLLPVTLKGARTPFPIEHRLQVASAQVKSALLLAALNVPGRSTVIERAATRDHTERMIKAFGGKITVEALSDGASAIHVIGEAEFKPIPIAVPSDPSSAAFPLVAALIVPGSTRAALVSLKRSKRWARTSRSRTRATMAARASAISSCVTRRYTAPMSRPNARPR